MLMILRYFFRVKHDKIFEFSSIILCRQKSFELLGDDELNCLEFEFPTRGFSNDFHVQQEEQASNEMFIMHPPRVPKLP